jgi:hypothetical protein
MDDAEGALLAKKQAAARERAAEAGIACDGAEGSPHFGGEALNRGRP